MKPRSYEALRANHEAMTGQKEIGFNLNNLPIKEIALAIAAHADSLGLVWRLVPGTVAPPGAGGVTRVTLDGDTVAIDAVTMIGRLPVGGRVFVMLTPPAGAHIVGFLGYDFPPSVVGEAIGRSRMISTTANFDRTSSTVAPVTGMEFTVVPNAVYEVRLRASFGGDIATDAKVSWTIPSGGMERYASGVHVGELNNYAASVVLMGRRGATTEQASATFSGGGSGSTDFSFYSEDCQLRVGATGGLVQLNFARNSGSGTATLRSNSYMIVQRYR